uniref:Protein kinase domain-containing protein n=1 Tax=Spongospora subterranea TaxID=70186 RepID=A0A0H5QHT8_9EUKA|eukprot:CRZ01604.1 hypothetical protein [Spongospora subterranea]
MGQCSTKSEVSQPNNNMSQPADIADRFGILQRSPWEVYERRGDIGEGGFSKIYRARHRTTGKDVAIKSLDKMLKHSRDTFLIEVKLLNAVNHESVINIHETYEDKHAYYIILDLLRGKDLFEVLDAKRDVFSEVIAATLIRSMMEAVRYCHNKNIVHLDLKPENFVFEKASDINRLVLVDFGLGRIVRDDAYYRDRVGSMQYIAPEMIEETSVCSGVTLKACDLWSMGVILYILVTGLIPFSNWEEVKVGRLRLTKSMSKELRDLLKNLLTRDTHKRLTADQVLNHPWLTSMSVKKNPIYEAVAAGVDYLAQKPKLSPLMESVVSLMHESIVTEDKHEIDALIEEFDVDNDGTWNEIDIKGFTERLGIKGSETVLIELSDKTGTGIGKPELVWLAAIGMLVQKTNSSKKRMAFSFGQRKPKPYITRQEVIRVGLKGIDPKLINDLFANVPVQERSSIVLFEDFADAIVASNTLDS